MPYRLDLADEVPATVRDCATEELRDAVRLLRDERDDDPVEAVHGARKDLKKARALLRLVRPGLPKRAYRRENGALRDVARTLAGTRDADVLVETLDALRGHVGEPMDTEAVASLRAALVAERDAQRARADAAISGEVVNALEAAVARVAAWPLDDATPKTLRRGAKRAYARGRAAFAVADAQPTVENLHEWRKRVKDLWYHARLLEDAWAGPMGAHADEAHALSDALGDDHDLALLAERVDDGDPLREAIAERRAELLEAARRRGRRLYAEKPKAHGRRLGRYLDAAARERPVGSPA